MLAPGGNAYARTDLNGNYYVGPVQTPWTGSISPYLPGWTFVVAGDPDRAAAATFTAIGANQTGVDFLAIPAYGLRAELALRRPASAVYYLDYDNDGSPESTVPFGVPTDVALAGDVDGDGISVPVLFRDGTWYASTHQDGSADRRFDFGAATDTPLLADMDGDGTADLVVFRDGTWYVSTKRNGVADMTFYFGQAGDVPLIGDFNGDGIADLALFRNGIWYVDTDRNGVADVTIAFGGVSGEIPLALDFDGDGRTDIAVFRDGLWWINTTLGGSPAIGVFYGDKGDKPLAGYFNRANTRFVKAGAGCMTGCTRADPYGTIAAAWQEAVDGDILRIASGTYPESLAFGYPGDSYLPGKFGKNNIKLIGVSKFVTTVSPATGDALFLRGASGYVLRGLRLASQAPHARGLVLAGGVNSALPTFPGAQVNVSVADIVESDGTNALLTGSSNAWFDHVRLNRSHAGHGLSAWGNTYVRVVASEIADNGYAVAPDAAPPDAGKGIDLRDKSEGDARSSRLRSNLTYGVAAVGPSVLRLLFNTIDSNGVDGVSVCSTGVGSDPTFAYVQANWIAANGFNWPGGPGSGMEMNRACSFGTNTIDGNVFVGNALNGLSIGSGWWVVSNNRFQANAIGLALYASDGLGGDVPSSTNTNVRVVGNTFDGNARAGVYAERSPGTVTRDVMSQIGDPAWDHWMNFFRNYAPPTLHAISCSNVTTNFLCKAGGNFFDHSGDDVETPACNTACVSTP